jgi:DNA-binding HxlR family transcriptional regulator
MRTIGNSKYLIDKVVELKYNMTTRKERKQKMGEELFFTVERDPYNFVMKLFLNRWKPFIIQAMRFDGVTRYNRFTKQLPISEKVLAQNLKELEADGIVYRKIYSEIPPHVEYRLTDLGKSITPILDMLYDWGWHEMKRRDMPIDPLGEMWHGFRERDEELMESAYKKQAKGLSEK